MNSKKNKLRLTPWWKGFLTSILGTTISIALTFGTTALLNRYKKKEAQRLTAMMVIDDVNKSIETLKNIRQNELDGYNAAMYMMTHLDSIYYVPIDTVELAVNYLAEGVDVNSEQTFNESGERMFHSTQEAWTNLKDVTFIRNVEDFYMIRNMLKNVMAENPFWSRPVSKAESDSILTSTDLLDVEEKRISYITKLLKSFRCRKFLSNYSIRLQAYDQLIEDWVNVNEENKFLMNITDEEMKEFVERTTNKAHPVEEKEIIGMWSSSAVEGHFTEFEFKADHTFSFFDSQKTRQQIGENGDIPNDYELTGDFFLEIKVSGEWHIEGDSLIIVYHPSTVRANLNDDQVVYTKEALDKIKQIKQKMSKAAEMRSKKAYGYNGGRRSRAANIDITGNRLELITFDKKTSHYKRKK